MSESESIKAEIYFHEKMFFAALALIFGLIGWMASNYSSAQGFILVIAFLAVVGAGAFGIYQYRLIKQLIVELKDV